uniref:Small ribosomal subunit protein uS2c n=1 Tax=Chlamydomonas nivalis TaxID=47906 RepID=A0A0S2IBU8_9CHLO|nr:ribosomal protein S2 [Chlamydomonas nivalis]
MSSSSEINSLDKGNTVHNGKTLLEDGKEKIKVGDILTVKLNKIAIQTDNSSIGIVYTTHEALKYQFIIPNVAETNVGQEIKIQVTKMKLKYGFALIKSSINKSDQVKLPGSLMALPYLKSLQTSNYKQNLLNEPILGLQKGFANLPKPFISLSSRPSEAYVFGNSLPLHPTDSVHKSTGFPSLYIPKVNNYGQKITPNNSSFSSLISGSLAQAKLAKKINYKPFNIANMTKGSKITLTLPKTAKKYAKYLVINMLTHKNIDKNLVMSNHENDGKANHNSYILFIKNLLGAKLGDKVRLKFTKIGSSFAIGEIICISPNSSLTKLARVRKNLNEMLINGMHYGEKVVKCQAKMRSFAWNRKKISVISNSATEGTFALNSNNYNAVKDSETSGASVAFAFAKKSYSFGYEPISFANSQASNVLKGQSPFSYTKNLLSSAAFPSAKGMQPKAKPRSQGSGKRGGERGKKQVAKLTNQRVDREQPLEASKNLSLNKNVALIKKGRHLINLLKTRRCLNIGLNQLTKYAAKGRTFLFVGTKKPAAGLIARAALFSKTSFFVNTRWLGGMLTNWKTIIKSISKIRPILKEKQKVISNILQKRSKIQHRLLKKVFSLRKKSKLLIKKGKQLIAKVKIANGTASSSLINVNAGAKEGLANNISEASNTKNSFNENYLKLNQINIKRKELFEKGQSLLEKRQNLLNKQKELKEKTLNLKENGFLITNKYKVLLTQLRTTHTKLHDLRLLFLLNKELRKIKKLAKDQGKNKFILSYGKFKQLTTLATEKNNQGTLLASSSNDSAIINGNKNRDSRNFNTDFINSKKFWLIPNPPQEILNKLLSKINQATLKTSIPFQPMRSKDSSKAAKAELTKQDISDKTKQKQAKLNQASLTSFLNSMAWNKGPYTLAPDQNHFSIKEKNTTSILNESKLIILTKLLSKFSRFLPYIKNCINLIKNLMQHIEKKIMELKINLKYLKKTLTGYLLLNKKINSELELIKTKYLSEQQIIRVLRRKLKRHEAEKKLLQFLPKLRYLPTPKNQISVAIQLLMKRFVDPKMKYPLDLIYDQASLRKKSKKVAAARKKKWQRLETYFGGIANMTKLKKTQIAKNVAIIIGQQEEINAIRECKKLGIKMFHIVDTNCNPGLADHFIPANDDSRNSIKYLLSKMVTRIRLAQKIRLRLKKK